MDWTPIENGWTATGQWIWELTPHVSVYGCTPDTWVMKGRHPQERTWTWFGAYQTLEGAKQYAEKKDTKAHHAPRWRAETEDDDD